jgi:hypothetical protein
MAGTKKKTLGTACDTKNKRAPLYIATNIAAFNI